MSTPSSRTPNPKARSASRTYAQEVEETQLLKRRLLTGDLTTTSKMSEGPKGTSTPTPFDILVPVEEADEDFSLGTREENQRDPLEVHNERFNSIVDLQQHDIKAVVARQQEADSLLGRLRNAFDVCKSLELPSQEKLQGETISDFIEQSHQRRKAMLGGSAANQHRGAEAFRSALETERLFKNEVDAGGELAADERLILLTIEERRAVDPTEKSDVDQLGEQLGLLNEAGEWKNRFCGCMDHFEDLKAVAEQSARTYCKAKYMTAFVHRLDVMIEYVHSYSKQASERQEHLLSQCKSYEAEIVQLKSTLDATITLNKRFRAAAKEGGVRTDRGGIVTGYDEGLLLEASIYAKANAMLEGMEMMRQDADAYIDPTRMKYLKSLARGGRDSKGCQTISDRELLVVHGVDVKTVLSTAAGTPTSKSSMSMGNSGLANAVLTTPHLDLKKILQGVEKEIGGKVATWGRPIERVDDDFFAVRDELKSLLLSLDESVAEMESRRVEGLFKIALGCPAGNDLEEIIASAVHISNQSSRTLREAVQDTIKKAAIQMASDVRGLKAIADDNYMRWKSGNEGAAAIEKQCEERISTMELKLSEANKHISELQGQLFDLEGAMVAPTQEGALLPSLAAPLSASDSNSNQAEKDDVPFAPSEHRESVTEPEPLAPVAAKLKTTITSPRNRGGPPKPKAQKVVKSTVAKPVKASTPIEGAAREVPRKSSVAKDHIRELLLSRQLAQSREGYRNMEEALCRIMRMLGDLHGPILEEFDASYGRTYLSPILRRELLHLGDHLVPEDGASGVEEDLERRDVVGASNTFLTFINGLGDSLAKRLAEVPIPKELVELSLVVENRLATMEGACTEAGLWGREDVNGVDTHRLPGISTSLISTMATALRRVPETPAPQKTEYLVNTLRSSIGAKRRGQSLHVSTPFNNSDPPLLDTLLCHLHNCACRIDVLTSTAMQRRLPSLVNRATVATSRMDILGSKVEEIVNSTRMVIWNVNKAMPALANIIVPGKEAKVFSGIGAGEAVPDSVYIQSYLGADTLEATVRASPMDGSLRPSQQVAPVTPEENTVRMAALWSTGLQQYSKAFGVQLQLLAAQERSVKMKATMAVNRVDSLHKTFAFDDLDKSSICISTALPSPSSATTPARLRQVSDADILSTKLQPPRKLFVGSDTFADSLLPDDAFRNTTSPQSERVAVISPTFARRTSSMISGPLSIPVTSHNLPRMHSQHNSPTSYSLPVIVEFTAQVEDTGSLLSSVAAASSPPISSQHQDPAIQILIMERDNALSVSRNLKNELEASRRQSAELKSEVSRLNQQLEGSLLLRSVSTTKSIERVQSVPTAGTKRSLERDNIVSPKPTTPTSVSPKPAACDVLPPTTPAPVIGVKPVAAKSGPSVRRPTLSSTSQTTMMINPVISSEVQTDEPTPTPSLMAGEVTKCPVRRGRDNETQTSVDASPFAPLNPASLTAHISSDNIPTHPAPHDIKQATTPKAAHTLEGVSSSKPLQLDQAAIVRIPSSREDGPLTHKKRRSGSPAFFPSAYPEPIPSLNDDLATGYTVDDTTANTATTIETNHQVAPFIIPAAENDIRIPRSEAPETSPLGAAMQQQPPRRRLSLPEPLERACTTFSEDSVDTVSSPHIHSPHSPVSLPRKRATVSPSSSPRTGGDITHPHKGWSRSNSVRKSISENTMGIGRKLSLQVIALEQDWDTHSREGSSSPSSSSSDSDSDAPQMARAGSSEQGSMRSLVSIKSPKTTPPRKQAASPTLSELIPRVVESEAHNSSKVKLVSSDGSTITTPQSDPSDASPISMTSLLHTGKAVPSILLSPQATPADTMESSLSSFRPQNSSFVGYHAFEGSLNASGGAGGSAGALPVSGEHRLSTSTKSVRFTGGGGDSDTPQSGSMTPARAPPSSKVKRVSFPSAGISVDSVGIYTDEDEDDDSPQIIQPHANGTATPPLVGFAKPPPMPISEGSSSPTMKSAHPEDNSITQGPAPRPSKRPAAPKRRLSHSPVQEHAAVEADSQHPVPLEARRRTIADRAHIQMQRRKRRGTQPIDQDPEDPSGSPLRSENLSFSSLAPGTLLQADDDSGGVQLKRVRTISDILRMPGRDSRDRRMTLALLQEAKDADNQRNFSLSGEKKKQEQSEAVLDAFRAMLCITSPTGEEVDLESEWDISSAVDAQLPLPAAMQPEESNRRLVQAASQGGARGKLAMVIMRAMAVGKMQRLLKLQRAKPPVEEEQVVSEKQSIQEAAPQPKPPPVKKRGVLDMEEVNRLLRLEVESRREEDERAAAANMSPLLTADVTPRGGGGASAWVGHLPKFNDSVTLATPELLTVISEPDSNPSPQGAQSPTKQHGESTEMGSSESLFGVKQVHTDSTPASEAATVDDVILIHERIHEFARITFAASGVDLRSGAGASKDGDHVLSLQERGRRAYLRSLEMLEAHFFFHPDAMFKEETKSTLCKKIGGHIRVTNPANEVRGGGSGSNTPVPEHVLMKHAKSVPTTVFDVLEVSADLVMCLLEQVKEFNLNQHLDAIIIQIPTGSCLEDGHIGIPQSEYDEYMAWKELAKQPKVEATSDHRIGLPTAPKRAPPVVVPRGISRSPPRTTRAPPMMITTSKDPLATLLREHHDVIRAMVPTAVDSIDRSHMAARPLRVDATAPRDPSPPHSVPRITAPIPQGGATNVVPIGVPGTASTYASRLLADPMHRLATSHKLTPLALRSKTVHSTAPLLAPLARSTPDDVDDAEPDPRNPSSLQRKLPKLKSLSSQSAHPNPILHPQTIESVDRLNKLFAKAPPSTAGQAVYPAVDREPTISALRSLRGGRAAAEARRQSTHRSASPDDQPTNGIPPFFVYSVASNNAANMMGGSTPTVHPEADTEPTMLVQVSSTIRSPNTRHSDV